MAKFARVSVNISQISSLFDYSIPEELEKAIQTGSLVIVPFGRQTVQGVVTSLPDEPSIADTKDILSLIDERPAFTPAQLELAAWLAEENLGSTAEFLDNMIPPGLSQHVDTLYHALVKDLPSEGLTPLQNRILTLLHTRGDLRGSQLENNFPRLNWRSSMPGLIKQGFVSGQAVLLPPTAHPKTVRGVTIKANPSEIDLFFASENRLSENSRARRKKILEYLQSENKTVENAVIYAETGATAGDLKYLAEHGLIEIAEVESIRDPLASLTPVLEHSPVLNTGQTAVWKELEKQINRTTKNKPNLLIGVTGSGKTEIYLRAVEATLEKNKKAIVLVPEISLTPQTVRRFMARFPGKVGLLHSGLSQGERYDTWRRIRAGELPVVVGARSALFAPLDSLGLIVIDECHDESYCQDDFRPYYSAVEAALEYSRSTGAVLILGSATPNIEQIYRARHEKWNELHLPDRILAHQPFSSNEQKPAEEPGVIPLPPVEVIDMREELKSGNHSVFSRSLRNSIHDTLDRNEQIILFLNRRGSATYVFCRDCGYVARCPRCNTQLVYHGQEGSLICHVCNYRRNMPVKCPNCGSNHIRQFGLGTESLEKKVIEEFPSARVLRWDADTSRFKGAHDLILDHFSQHRADILIGTKMLAKGLDLPLVTLVGAVLADVSLNLPDFRAAERTFQILSQVAGRAGRSGRGGKAVFQTFHPENYAIQAASLHDLEGFYTREIEFRKNTNYPPFTRLVRLEFKHYQELWKALVFTY